MSSNSTVVACPTCQRHLPAGSAACPYCGQDLCPECGAAISPEDTQCPKCGVTWQLFCPLCEHEVGPHDAICRNCGASLSDTTPCPHCGAQMDVDLTTCPSCGGERCPNCNAALRADALECPKCGEKFVLTCPDCGVEVNADAEKCPECGASFYESEITPADVLAGETPCPHCGSAVHREDGLCSECGASFCPRCLALTKDEDEQCPGCGLALYFECPDCGEQLLTSTPICPACDRLFARKCPSCGFTDLWGALLTCPQCHNALPAEKQQTARTPTASVAEIASRTQARCPQCGQRFDPGFRPLPEVQDKSLCPKCHARLFEDEWVCPQCGAPDRFPLSQLPGSTLARHNRVSRLSSVTLPAVWRSRGCRRDGVRNLWHTIHLGLPALRRRSRRRYAGMSLVRT